MGKLGLGEKAEQADEADARDGHGRGGYGKQAGQQRPRGEVDVDRDGDLWRGGSSSKRWTAGVWDWEFGEQAAFMEQKTRRMGATFVKNENKSVSTRWVAKKSLNF